MDDRLALLEAEALQHRVHALGAEDAHQIVFEREEELRGAGIALAAGAAAQLVVDAPALMPLAADDEEPAAVERDLPLGARSRRGCARCARASRSALVDARRVSRLRRISRLPPSWMSVPRPAMLVAMVTAPGPPACGDDIGLLLVVAGVQHLVRDLAAS